MSDTSSKDALTERLAILIGFEDGALDVLDHLLSIESETDLMDYMSQLLGQENESIRSFVQDVCRFQKGETIVRLAPTGNTEHTEKKDSKPNKSTTKKKVPEQSGRPNARSKTPPPKKETGNKPAAGGRTHHSQNKAETRKPNNTGQTETKPLKSNKNSTKPASSPTLETSTKPVEKPPPRGKATIVCGCFGTKHKCLTNCLYCGRISCEREGYDYCPFCGFLVKEFKATPPESGSGETANDSAWKHKERLLRFDKDFARRTVVFDDQADYFANKTSSWLTEKEKQDAAQADDEQQTQLHQRKKQQLSIEF